MAYDCKLLHSKSNQSLEQIFKTIGIRDTPNEEYLDDWSLHTPLEKEYNHKSVLHLSIAIMELELEEIEEKKAKKKKEREDKKKKNKIELMKKNDSKKKNL